MEDTLASPICPATTPSGGEPVVRDVPFVVSMHSSHCAKRALEPVYSEAMPLSEDDFHRIMDRLNQAVLRAAPVWQRWMPLVIVGVGFSLCILGVVIVVPPSIKIDPSGDEVFIVGVCLLTLGVIGSFCTFTMLWRKAVMHVRMQLCKVNEEYMPQGIDFQLVEWAQLRRLGNYTTNIRQMRRHVRTVRQHALVVTTAQARASMASAAAVKTDVSLTASGTQVA